LASSTTVALVSGWPIFPSQMQMLVPFLLDFSLFWWYNKSHYVLTHHLFFLICNFSSCCWPLFQPANITANGTYRNAITITTCFGWSVGILVKSLSWQVWNTAVVSPSTERFFPTKLLIVVASFLCFSL
jgi:hypothetical protein